MAYRIGLSLLYGGAGLLVLISLIATAQGMVAFAVPWLLAWPLAVGVELAKIGAMTIGAEALRISQRGIDPEAGPAVVAWLTILLSGTCMLSVAPAALGTGGSAGFDKLAATVGLSDDTVLLVLAALAAATTQAGIVVLLRLAAALHSPILAVERMLEHQTAEDRAVRRRTTATRRRLVDEASETAMGLGAGVLPRLYTGDDHKGGKGP